MPINLRPAAGTRVFASATAPATFDDAGWGALSDWAEIGGFDNVGEVGDADEVGNFDSLTDGRIKYRAINDPGTISASPADNPADAGQILCAAAKAAAKGSAAEKLSIRIEDEAGYGTWCQVLVAKWSRQWGGASDVQMRMAEMPIIAGTIWEYTP